MLPKNTILEIADQVGVKMQKSKSTTDAKWDKSINEICFTT